MSLHRYRLLLPFEECVQAVRNSDFFSDYGLHGVFELGRVGSFKEYASFIGGETFKQASVCYSSMRVKQVALLSERVAQGLGYLFVGVCAA